MEPVLVVVFGVGAVVGFVVGRWWAERRRAKFDMNAVWMNRRRYRGK